MNMRNEYLMIIPFKLYLETISDLVGMAAHRKNEESYAHAVTC
jgi:hypothetical protein